MSAELQARRLARASEAPIVGSLPPVPGILAAMALQPEAGRALQGLADALMVFDFPGSTLRRGERELIATAVSAKNDCFFCMDSHAAFATELLTRERVSDPTALVQAARSGAEGLDARMTALAAIARQVAVDPRGLGRADVERALAAGASDGDVQLAILIASAFCMYNRMVDGLRAATPPDPAMFGETAVRIADHGYSNAPPPGAPVAEG